MSIRFPFEQAIADQSGSDSRNVAEYFFIQDHISFPDFHIVSSFFIWYNVKWVYVSSNLAYLIISRAKLVITLTRRVSLSDRFRRRKEETALLLDHSHQIQKEILQLW